MQAAHGRTRWRGGGASPGLGPSPVGPGSHAAQRPRSRPVRKQCAVRGERTGCANEKNATENAQDWPAQDRGCEPDGAVAGPVALCVDPGQIRVNPAGGPPPWVEERVLTETFLGLNLTCWRPVPGGGPLNAMAGPTGQARLTGVSRSPHPGPRRLLAPCALSHWNMVC